MFKVYRFLLLSIVAGLAFTGCLDFPGEPVAPSWDVQVSAALARTSHSIRELVSDIASLPPEVLDTLDLSRITIRYENNVVLGDTTGDGIDDSGLTGEFFRSVSQARLFVEAVNGTPVALDISLRILAEDGHVLLVLPGVDSLLQLAAAPLDATGKVGTPTNAMAVVDMDDGLAAVLENGRSLSYTIDMTFPQNVTIDHVLTSDSLAIRTWGTFVSRVDP